MSATLEALQKVAGEFAGHPAGFGVGVGIANGILAEVRGMPMTTKTALLTAGALGIAEALLMAEVPGRKHSLVEVGLWSAAGVLAGLFPFVSNGTEQSYVQQLTGRPIPAIA